MTIYGISGLGADERVFQYLELSQKIAPIHWIEPKEGESIQSYAGRLSEQIKDDEFILIAVSFGGLIAVELNKMLKPRLTILISSADTKNGLRTVYRLIGKSGLIRFIPSFLFAPPRTLMYWLFGARNKTLLREILDDTDLKFTKWSITQLIVWNNVVTTANLIKIHGTNDKLIPFKPDHQTVAIPNGAHFMIVDNASEISRIIEERVKAHLSAM